MSAAGGNAPARRPARLVVVGGGVTGLAAAHRALERTPRGELDVVVLEATARVGGVVATQRRGGFVVEGGPDSFITEKPAAIELCRRLGLGDQLLPTNDRWRRTLVVRDGRLVALPEGFQLLGPTRILPFLLSPVLSLRGKLAAAKDLVLPRGGPPPGGDESLAHFVRRRLGREVLERLAQPLAGGIYTADPETLSLASTMPRFLELERRHRSVILGLRAQARRAGATAAASGARFGLFVTLQNGMESMIEGLAARLPQGAVRTNARVRALRPAPAADAAWGVVLEGGEVLAADAVVLALPGPAAGALLEPLDPELGHALRAIAYASS
ncbi:MAG: protoporphyrinogen oxidase, partial [Thermodesulfobacteriota bacterium]